jgi:hypothetical protein
LSLGGGWRFAYPPYGPSLKTDSSFINRLPPAISVVLNIIDHQIIKKD